jgi:hypothetical protein
MNVEEKELRDKHLKKAGFDIEHIWCSEIERAPEIPYANLAKLFEISNPPSISKKRESEKVGKKKQVSRSPKSPRKKEYKI